MENALIAVSHFFSQTPNKILRSKWIVLLILVVGTAFMAVGIVQRTSMDMSMEGFLHQDDPAILALNRFRDQFGSDDSVFLVYRAKDGDAFSANSLHAIQALTNDLNNWQSLSPQDYPQLVSEEESFQYLSHIRRVQSLASIRVQTTRGDTLRSDRLVPKELPTSADGLALIRERAMAQEDFKLAFYSLDGEYAAVMIQTNFGAQLPDDFVAAVNSDDIVLDDSFDFSADQDFALDFDETAEVQDIDYVEADMLAYVDFYEELKAVYGKYDEHFEFFPVGNAPLMEYGWRIQQQMMGLGVGMVLIFTLLLWILFRSFSAVIWPILTIAVSVTWVWGATAWLGIEISQMISLTIMLIFAVGIADCVHVMSAYLSNRRNNLEHYEALSKAYGKTGLALLVTSITTMAGLLALSFAGLLPIKVFALMSAAGVGTAFLFTIILLPMLLDIWHPGKPNSVKGRGEKFAEWWLALSPRYKVTIAVFYFALVFFVFGLAIGSFVTLVSLVTYVVVNWQKPILETVPVIASRYPYVIVACFASVFILCAYGTSKVKIDSNLSELFYEDSEIRIAYNAVDDNMAGAQSLEIMIDTGEIDGLLDPQLLQTIERFQERVEEKYPDEVSRSFSLANIVKNTNKIMNNNDVAFEKVPDDSAMISQLLYLFNSANPEDRRSIVSDDYSRSHITINVYNAGSYQYKQFFEELSIEIDSVFGELKAERFPELDVQVTGSIALMMRALDEIASSQYRSFALALGVISVILIFTLGSLQGGMIAVIPNLLPALVTFGLLGLLDISLDTDTLLIAPVVIGIAVDDTIHFMTHYRVALIRTGDMARALQSTLRDVGQAVMFTTMVLGLGFGLLSFSEYLGMAKVGFFGAIAIFVALLCDLFLLPALLLIFKPTFGLKNVERRFDFKGESA